MNQKTLTDYLRYRIGLYEGGHLGLAGETKVPQPTISRFVAGQDIKLSTVDKLLPVLKIEFGSLPKDYEKSVPKDAAPPKRKGRGKSKRK